ncbi:MAG: sodium ion-translocating decarboxylase subunit beta [Prevotellaceae bacterium]|nr:sodium ion-translocating decarboxylase subunit beta [Prevotellaceae bacterium]
MNEIFNNLYEMTALSNLIADPSYLIMYAIAFVLLYLGIVKHYEPLLLIPIAFGVLIANFPGGEMGVLQASETGEIIKDGKVYNIWEMSLPAIAHDLGLMNFLYYMLIKTGFLPPVIFMGVGALTDFGPMLRNLRLSIFGAAAQLGIFAVLLCSFLMGFTLKEAASLGIIGGADGPTAIYTTIKLAPHLLGPIAIAAYSYMALVPVIIPLVVKFTCSKKELMINMKEQDKLYPSKNEIKNMRVIKIIFPIAVTTVVAIFVPSAVSLIGMLMFGNLLKEIGSDTSRLFDTISNSIMNTATVFLGLCVGATMTVQAFLNWTTIGIIIGGFLAFALSITSGIMMVKVVNIFSKKKINPLIGATGLSAVPMASRVCNEIATKYDPKNHVLNYCMSSNISGVIGSAVAAGVLISFLS